MRVEKLSTSVERGADGIECLCHGYAERVDTTPEEDAQFGCGRSRCCSRAFVCKLCGMRLIGTADAPESS